jgi:hypothetical protein
MKRKRMKMKSLKSILKQLRLRKRRKVKKKKLILRMKQLKIDGVVI